MTKEHLQTMLFLKAKHFKHEKIISPELDSVTQKTLSVLNIKIFMLEYLCNREHFNSTPLNILNLFFYDTQ